MSEVALERTYIFKAGRKLSIDGRTFTIDRPVGRGGSGEVYRATEGRHEFAVKVFYPFFEEKQGALFNNDPDPSRVARSISDSVTFQEKEYENLSRLLHPNVVRVHVADSVSLKPAELVKVRLKNILELPVIVTDFVPGKTLLDAINSDPEPTGPSIRDPAILFNVLKRIALALDYLHFERRCLHADIKAANVMLREYDLEPVIIDFALSKNFDVSGDDAMKVTRLIGDRQLFPDTLDQLPEIKMMRDRGAPRADVENAVLPALDRFQFGKMLAAIEVPAREFLEPTDFELLCALRKRLTQWTQIKQLDEERLAPMVEQIGPSRAHVFGVPELSDDAVRQRSITLPPGISVPITDFIEKVIENRSFRRLGYVHQLSLVHYIYPAADYKRRVHSLHAFELARRFARALNGSPEFRLRFDKRTTRQLLLAALLHDINHFPFLHIFQESRIESLNRTRVLDLFCDGEATHERANGEMSLYELLAEAGIERERFATLILSKPHEQSGKSEEVDQIMSSLLNSGVDVDKLSYLMLDSHFTGVSFGNGIDLPTILRSARIGNVQSGNRRFLHLCFADKSIQALESVVMTRFWAFRAIYWHHTNRALMAMLLSVVRKLYQLREGQLHAPESVLTFMRDTMWKTDSEALSYLDARHFVHFGRASPLGALAESRRAIYKRVYTVQAGMDDDAENSLQQKFKAMSPVLEDRFRRNMAMQLNDAIGTRLASPIDEDQVLRDVPRRDVDDGGPVYVQRPDSQVVMLSTISDPIRAIHKNYELMTKRVRIFVAPDVARTLVAYYGDQLRERLHRMVTEAVQTPGTPSQVV